MPTIFTHAVIPLASALALGQKRIPRRVLAVGMMLAMLPDADVIGFALGIDYADVLGHRGASHSLVMAVILAALATAALRPDKAKLVFAFLFVSTASHGILDAFTSGGLGPALAWPIDDTRYFAPMRPIRVSPIGMDFFSGRGVVVILSELTWVWGPALVAAFAVRLGVAQTQRHDD
jgi:inner membrane protein